MQILQAPDNGLRSQGPHIFLAGGITNCPNWQDDVIEELKKLEPIYGVLEFAQVINPRNKDFDVNDKDASLKQIKWEHYYLNKCEIISYFFCNSESVQPITLYELGRYRRRGKDQIITVEMGYKRMEDVIIQSALDKEEVQIYSTYEDAISNHALRIAAKAEEYTK